jgi:DNA modification methylase
MNRCVQGDCRDLLPTMIAEGVRVQTCITSPPYWGLRDYGTAQWDGGDTACDHLARPGGGSSVRSTLVGTHNRAGYSADGQARGTCAKCGAVRVDRQIGMESTPGEYVATLVGVFRLVRDLLRDDGTLWLNLGDSYSMTTKGAGGRTPKQDSNAGSRVDDRHWSIPNGLKAKDLVGIPWRVAFALQADGWYLRQDIIWHKPNPMPESVTDRCTKAHEYIFLLAKAERYYFDAAAIAESANSFGRKHTSGIQPPKVIALVESGEHGAGGDLSINYERESRNRRSVWTVASSPYDEAHFATFPPALIEPCVAAGSRIGDVVFDPFHGSGTVGQVAQRLGRQWLACELNPQYLAMQARRTAQSAFELP